MNISVIINSMHYVPEVRGLLGEDDEEAKHKGYTPYFPKEVNV